MPLLTIVVPAYNAEDYLHRALAPLARLDRAERGVEVIVVDDGSTDSTGMFADEYARRRPDLFRVVHQPNRGHGGAINTGVEHAEGDYLMVLDADDWLNLPVLESVLSTLADLEKRGGTDALFTDYVHDRVGKNNRLSRFDSVFPAGRIFDWDDTGRFGRRQYLMMHAIIYRTSIVRASGLRLPEHTFYVDNLYVVVPLAHVRRMYYLPMSLYHYFIGRADQSVNADIMLRRIDQQLRVNKLALQALPSPAAVAGGEIPARLYSALVHYVEAVCAVTSATLAHGDREHFAMRVAFWREVKSELPWAYGRLRRGFIGASSNLPGQAGRQVTSIAYRVARRVVGFS
jgi:glycosyltransferase involved in cell wall biosynthesis